MGGALAAAGGTVGHVAGGHPGIYRRTTVLLCVQASDHERPVSSTLPPTLPPQPPAASFPLSPLPSPAGAKGLVPFRRDAAAKVAPTPENPLGVLPRPRGTRNTKGSRPRKPRASFLTTEMPPSRPDSNANTPPGSQEIALSLLEAAWEARRTATRLASRASGQSLWFPEPRACFSLHRALTLVCCISVPGPVRRPARACGLDGRVDTRRLPCCGSPSGLKRSARAVRARVAAEACVPDSLSAWAPQTCRWPTYVPFPPGDQVHGFGPLLRHIPVLPEVNEH